MRAAITVCFVLAACSSARPLDPGGDGAALDGALDGALDFASAPDLADLACNQFGHDPSCASDYCWTVFPSGGLSGRSCTTPGASCFYWCNQMDGWQVTCGADGVSSCGGDPSCASASADMGLVCF